MQSTDALVESPQAIEVLVEPSPNPTVDSLSAVRKYTAEVIGTFALVLSGTGAIVANDVSGGAVTHVGISLTFGLIVMAMIYTIGGISGAHINPAVTLAFWVAGRFEGRHVLPYVLAQLAGALAASGLLWILFIDHPTLAVMASEKPVTYGATLPSGPWWQSFILEIVLTFLLMYVVLHVSSGAKEQGIMAGVAIGGVVALEALFAGPICGASMNPARSFGPALVSGQLSSLWIYLTAPCIGAVLAIPTFRFVAGSSSA